MEIPVEEEDLVEVPANVGWDALRARLPGGGNAVVVALILLLLGLIVWMLQSVTELGGEGSGLAGSGLATFFICVAIGIGTAWFLIPAYLGDRMGKVRSIGAGTGFTLGLLLGWIGVLIVACFPYTGNTKCPHCAERIRAEAKVCRYCGREVGARLRQDGP